MYKALDEAGVPRQRQGVNGHKGRKPEQPTVPQGMGRFLCPHCDAEFYERRSVVKTHTECDACGSLAFVEPFPALMIGVRLAELIERLEAEGYGGGELAELEEAA